MADEREVFTILEDDVTGAGEKLPARQEGDLATAKNGLIGFAYKDQSNNLALPKLTANGAVPVDPGAANQKLFNGATITAVINSATDVAKITLDISQTYGCIGVTFSNTFTTLWELVQDNDGVKTVKDSWITGPGQYTVTIKEALADLEVISGASGVQELIIRGTQKFGVASDLHASVGARR